MKKTAVTKPRKIIRQKLFHLTSPIFIETLLIMLTGAVDVFMLSRYSDETVAAGDVMYPFVMGIIVMWGVATLLAYVLGIWWGWGLNGIWLEMALDENIRAVIFERRWKSRRWEDKSFVHHRA